MTDKQRQKKFELKTEIETWMSHDYFFDVRISWLYGAGKWIFFLE